MAQAMADVVQKRQGKLRTEGVDDRTDEQGAEQTLCHGGHGIDAVSFRGKNDVLAFEKCFEFVHAGFSLYTVSYQVF